MSENSPPLKQVAEINIEGIVYDLASNGEFSLVEHREPDAYARPVARRVDLLEWLGLVADHGAIVDFERARSRAQALLNLLGQATVDLKATKAALERVPQEGPK